jgi:hypothetical protein
MADNRFRNWQNAVDIDYLSLYIKTWFAFLGTVQELHPDAINGNGDGSLMHVYKDSVSIPVKFNDVMIPHIEKLYTIGFEAIKRDIPHSFFINFYTVNKELDMLVENTLTTFKVVEGNRVYDRSTIRLEYRDILDTVSNPNVLITIKSTGRKFIENLETHHLCFNIPLSEFIDENDNDDIDRVFRSQNACMTLMERTIQGKLYECVDNLQNLDIETVEERKGYCNGLLIPLIGLLRQQFETEKLFISLPLKGFSEQYTVEGNQRKILHWFISFNYQVRNLLFHSLIDPFNPTWLKLFKHAYLALKELVEHNIEKIEEQETHL